MKIKDPKDPKKEIEVFTAEELKAAETKATETATNAASSAAKTAADEAIENYKKSNPDKTAEVEKLKNDLSEVQAKLDQALSYDDKSGNRDEQIARLRKERDDAVAAVNKKVEELSTTIETMNKNQVAGLKETLLDEYAGKDPEARKKVELEFDNYRPNDTGLKAMTERMEKAVTLSGIKVEEKPDASDAARGHGGERGEGNYGGKPTKVTPNAVAIGKAMGVTEEELQKQAEKNATEKGASTEQK